MGTGKPLTATALRRDIYRVLDQVLLTGDAVEIERHGRRIRLIAVEPLDLLGALPRRHTIVGDPEALVELDWADAWKPQHI